MIPGNLANVSKFQVHRNQLGKIELHRAADIAAKLKAQKDKSDRLVAAVAKL